MKRRPTIEDYATIEAYVGKEETPVYAFGFTYVYGISPDLLPGATLQAGNRCPVKKIKPKKTWEITSNLCGSNPAREPKTMWNDDQPVLPIHLIDGNPETAWSTRLNGVPDRNPEWIRIDLPAETEISSVALVCCKVGPCLSGAMKFGKLLPGEVTVKLSCDAKQWVTVYENKKFAGPNDGASVIQFKPRRAKQIWIIINQLQNIGYLFACSIGSVEVRNTKGENLALVSKGAGVQTSSTYYGFGMDRFTQEMLWPLQYDLGMKWTRVGYDMGMYLWSYVEREKGHLKIDPKADAAVTEAANNGMNVIMVLDKGNWLYRNPARKTDWKKARTCEMMDTYWDHQGWPTDSPEMLEGYLRYVDYMVRHFKGRVAFYEILNEWPTMGKSGIANYARLVRATIPVIRKADPKAKIMMGSTLAWDRNHILAVLGKQPLKGVHDGKFHVAGREVTYALLQGVDIRDGSVSVDVHGHGHAGILLRYTDKKNFLLASFSAHFGKMYLRQIVDGVWGEYLHAKDISRLGDQIHLTASITGATVTFTVSDGRQNLSINHTYEQYQKKGQVALFHWESRGQAFDNFEVRDAKGKVLFSDGFDGKALNTKRWKVDDECHYGSEKPGLGEQFDAIGWHCFYQTDPAIPEFRNYRKDVESFRKECRNLGFKGQFAVTEWSWWAPYPEIGALWWQKSDISHISGMTEMQKAKLCAQLMVTHSGLDILSLYVELFQNSHDIDDSFLRNAFQCETISSQQPQPLYYVMRSLSTVMDGYKAAPMKVECTGTKALECYTFNKNGKTLVALWLTGRPVDGINEVKIDLTFPGLRTPEVLAYDLMNGTQQPIRIKKVIDGTVLPAILVKDYPVLIELETKSTNQRGKNAKKH